MKGIDLRNLSQILLDGIFDNELDNGLRKKILDEVPEENYDMACQIFHQTRKEYFELGLNLWSHLK